MKFAASQLEGEAALYGAAYLALRATQRTREMNLSTYDVRKNLVFAAACLGMLLFGIVFLSLGSVNNMLAERFRLDDRAIGTLTALLPFGILIGSLVFGPIVDRFGYRWMLVGRVADRRRGARRNGVRQKPVSWYSFVYSPSASAAECSTARPTRSLPMSARASAAQS